MGPDYSRVSSSTPNTSFVTKSSAEVATTASGVGVAAGEGMDVSTVVGAPMGVGVAVAGGVTVAKE